MWVWVVLTWLSVYDPLSSSTHGPGVGVQDRQILLRRQLERCTTRLKNAITIRIHPSRMHTVRYSSHPLWARGGGWWVSACQRGGMLGGRGWGELSTCRAVSACQGVSACRRVSTCHPPLDRILDTRLWKHYLSATSSAWKRKKNALGVRENTFLSCTPSVAYNELG